MKSSRSELTRLNTAPLLTAASAYADAGWPVLPLAPNAKTPLTSHGLKDASTDLDRIAAWWMQTPDANIGLRTGVAFDVLDIDSWRGAHEIRDLAGEYYHPGPVSNTGKGWHLLFGVTGAPNSAALREHVDFRGRSGYIVVAPSIHPSGTRYTWARGYLKTEMPEPTDWLLNLLTPPERHWGNSAPLSADATFLLGQLDLAAEFTAIGVQLRRESNRMRGKCPFHPDDTPSLVLYLADSPPQFRCFGCGAWGDALNVRRYQREGRLR